VNDADGAVPPAVTVTVRVIALEPAVSVTVSTTVKVPADAYVWEGASVVAVPPSPNVHDHEVGTPREASLKVTDWPFPGDGGANVNHASSGIRAGTSRTSRT